MRTKSKYFKKHEFAVMLKQAMGRLTQVEFAKKAGITQPQLSCFLNEKFDSAPTLNTIYRLVDASDGKIELNKMLELAGYEPEEPELFYEIAVEGFIKELVDHFNEMKIEWKVGLQMDAIPGIKGKYLCFDLTGYGRWLFYCPCEIPIGYAYMMFGGIAALSEDRVSTEKYTFFFSENLFGEDPDVDFPYAPTLNANVSIMITMPPMLGNKIFREKIVAQRKEDSKIKELKII